MQKPVYEPFEANSKKQTSHFNAYSFRLCPQPGLRSLNGLQAPVNKKEVIACFMLAEAKYGTPSASLSWLSPFTSAETN